MGLGYYLSKSAGAPEPQQANATLSLSYLEDEVLPGTEGGIAAFFQGADGRWRRLGGALDMGDNTVAVAAQGAGLYVLMSSLNLGPGWSMVAYPWAQAGSVRETLRQLNADGRYSTVYGYDEQDAADPWKVFDVGVPDEWNSDPSAPPVNDLEDLTYGRGYWINVAPGGGTAAGLAGALSLPPATYYGVIDFLPPGSGLELEARVGARICGRTRSAERTIEGRTRETYVLNVLAAGAGDALGCGTPGAPMTLAVLRDGEVIRQVTISWDNDRVLRIDFRATYLPLVIR